jgi:hypothetical protein
VNDIVNDVGIKPEELNMTSISQKAKNRIGKFLEKYGYKVSKLNTFNLSLDLTTEEKIILEYVFKNQLTMTSRDNLASTILAVRYIVNNKVEGDFIECGVWRGGHSIAAALTFKLYNTNRKVFCFDTFTGMSEPSFFDKRIGSSTPALTKYEQSNNPSFNAWCYSSIDEVRNNFLNAGIHPDNFMLIEGDVIKTLPDFKPIKVAFLRLDTDWYESTKSELEHLWPHLSKFGIITIDDYGHWEGSKQAVDEFFKTVPGILFTPIDYSARTAIKLD